MIHMKCQDLFSLETKTKSNLSSAAVVIGTLIIKELTSLWLLEL